MKTLRRYLLICMKVESELPQILEEVTQNGGNSKILDYHTHSVAIINTEMMFGKLSVFFTNNLIHEHYFLVQLKSNTNIIGSIPLRYARDLFNEDGIDDIIFYNESPIFDDNLDFNNKLKDAIRNLEGTLDDDKLMGTEYSLDYLQDVEHLPLSLDEILDKISDGGMDSLTSHEVDFLNKQSER